MSRRALAAVTTAVVVAFGVIVAGPASAVLPAGQVGVFPTWTVSGSSRSYTATPTFPASAGFPATTVTSNSTTLAAPSGVTAFLGTGTGFGAEYGSTRSQPYLTISANAGVGTGATASQTTISFATAPPLGWGFALGDIDADWAFIAASNASGPVAIGALGFRAVGNYCASTPRPGACVTPPFTDQPVWVTATENFDGTTYSPSTLRGNSLPGSPSPTRDTSGAYGWFQPTVPVTSLTILYGVRDGSPTAQLWLAASAPVVRLTGTVTGDPSTGGAVPPGTVVQLEDATGTPLLDIQDQPLLVPVDPSSGAWTADVEQRTDGYLAQVLPPAGFAVPAAIAVSGVPDAAGSPVATAPPVQVAAIAASPPPAPLVADPTLAASGAPDLRVAAAIAVASLGLGVGLLAAGRLRRRRATR